MAEPARPHAERRILDAADLARCLTRLAHEVVERNRTVDRMAFVGLLPILDSPWSHSSNNTTCLKYLNNSHHSQTKAYQACFLLNLHKVQLC